jgi:hypothetical protein
MYFTEHGSHFTDSLMKFNNARSINDQFIPDDDSSNITSRLNTVDLLVKVACFVRMVSNIFNFKMSLTELVSKRKSTVLTLPLQ